MNPDEPTPAARPYKPAQLSDLDVLREEKDILMSGKVDEYQQGRADGLESAIRLIQEDGVHNTPHPASCACGKCRAERELSSERKILSRLYDVLKHREQKVSILSEEVRRLRALIGRLHNIGTGAEITPSDNDALILCVKLIEMSYAQAAPQEEEP
jgi:hypothetical protein